MTESCKQVLPVLSLKAERAWAYWAVSIMEVHEILVLGAQVRFLYRLPMESEVKK